MKEMTVSNQKRINEIYRSLKEDLTRCIKYHRKWKPEYVKEYFNTDKREEIEKQLQVICKPFSDIQKIQISKVISDLHTFYILPQEKWLNKSEKKS
jgi:hypothetical protein